MLHKGSQEPEKISMSNFSKFHRVYRQIDELLRTYETRLGSMGPSLLIVPLHPFKGEVTATILLFF